MAVGIDDKWNTFLNKLNKLIEISDDHDEDDGVRYISH